MHHALLDKLFLEAVVDLLAASGVEPDSVAASSAGSVLGDKPGYMSVLSATGEGIALSSLITIDRDLLVSLHPMAGGDIPELDLEDWCRELNNQLVGRVKNKLLRFGIVVTLGLPVLLRGTNVKAVPAPDATVHQHSVRTPNGTISLVLAMLVDEDLIFVEQESTEEVMLEGAVSFF